MFWKKMNSAKIVTNVVSPFLSWLTCHLNTDLLCSTGSQTRWYLLFHSKQPLVTRILSLVHMLLCPLLKSLWRKNSHKGSKSCRPLCFREQHVNALLCLLLAPSFTLWFWFEQLNVCDWRMSCGLTADPPSPRTAGNPMDFPLLHGSR